MKDHKSQHLLAFKDIRRRISFPIVSTLLGALSYSGLYGETPQIMKDIVARAELRKGAIPKSPSRASFKKNENGRWNIYINGVETPIRGAGGVDRPGMLEQFKESGGNFTRTWGPETLEAKVGGGERYIDRAYRLGIHVMPGMWIGHERHGFDYHNPEQIQKQRNMVRETVRKYRDHPAVVMWGLGNEMEDPVSQTGKPIIFKELNILAKIIKEEDPNHPVMTIIAGYGKEKIENIKKHYPEIDALGINSYGAAAGAGENLVAHGWDKPFAITEFGVHGFWEVGKTAWGAPIEPHSTEKARTYYATHKLVYDTNDGKELCLGSFAFLWGWKQECTATWFGMVLPTFEKLPQVDAMVKAWTGKWPANRCPNIKKVHADFSSKRIGRSSAQKASVEVIEPNGDPMTYHWLVVEETKVQSEGGDHETACKEFPELVSIQGKECTFTTPEIPGAYRLFLTVRDGKGAAATANVPFFVQ
jgi:hypothetical protein